MIHAQITRCNYDVHEFTCDAEAVKGFKSSPWNVADQDNETNRVDNAPFERINANRNDKRMQGRF